MDSLNFAKRWNTSFKQRVTTYFSFKENRLVEWLVIQYSPWVSHKVQDILSFLRTKRTLKSHVTTSTSWRLKFLVNPSRFWSLIYVQCTTTEVPCLMIWKNVSWSLQTLHKYVSFLKGVDYSAVIILGYEIAQANWLP